MLLFTDLSFRCSCSLAFGRHVLAALFKTQQPELKHASQVDVPGGGSIRYVDDTLFPIAMVIPSENVKFSAPLLKTFVPASPIQRLLSVSKDPDVAVLLKNEQSAS